MPTKQQSKSVDPFESDKAEGGEGTDNFTCKGASGHQLEMIIESKGWYLPENNLGSPAFKAIAEAGLLALAQPRADNDHQSDQSTKDESPTPRLSRAVTILFSDDEAVRKLNKSYRSKDQPTNVLSFPSEDWQTQAQPESNAEESPNPGQDSAPEIYLGDAILAYETIKNEAKRHKIPLFEHTAHLVVHAVLHLLGYDHEEEHQADAMEKLESNLMLELGYKDPYAD